MRFFVDSFKEAIKDAAEAGSMPGVEVKFVTYDQRSDPGRVPTGYTWMKGQGVGFY